MNSVEIAFRDGELPEYAFSVNFEQFDFGTWLGLSGGRG
jgi:hypothetical protein